MTKTTPRARDVEHFEQWSPTYEDSYLQRLLFDPVHAAALQAPQTAPTVVLDIGCGTGRLLRDAQRRWPHVQLIGVDPAAGMIAIARENVPDAALHVGSAERLPMPDASVDVVFSTMSFHHWQDQAQGLGEIARVLRPGGSFILVDVAAPRLLARLFGNPRARDARSRRALFAGAGLRVVRSKMVRSPFVLMTVAVRDAAMHDRANAIVEEH